MSDLNSDIPATVLCVDDEASILKSLQRLFIGKPYRILLANSGKQGLEMLQQQQVQVIISDMRMPEMTGAEFLREAARMQPNAYRILMTGYADLASTIAAVNVGKIQRYVQKPWDNSELLEFIDEGLGYFRLIMANKQLTAKVAQQNKQLKQLNQGLEEQVQQRTQQLRQSLAQVKLLVSQREKESDAILEILYNIISINPRLSGDYAIKVSQLSSELAAALGVSAEQQQLIARAGLYSELGKLSFSTSLLEKPFHTLVGAERSLYLNHPQLAEEIMSPAVHLQPMVDIILHQYERYNGDGMPDQQVGEQIPLGARILAVARDFWGLLYKRLSENVHTQEAAYDWLQRQQGNLYDPQVIRQLQHWIQKQQQQPKVTQESSGLLLDQLRPGMQLSRNLYNRKQMMLLPKEHVLSQESINKLRQYQLKHKEVLHLQVDDN